MGKILESLGYIDGYDIIAIGKFRAKKDEIFEEILKVDDKIKDETRDIVNNSAGRVFAIVKKGIIKGIYLFKVEEKDDIKNLKHVKTVYTDEVAEDVREKYDNHVLKIAQDYVSEMEYDKVTLEDKVVQLDPNKDIGEKVLASILGYSIGFVFGWLVIKDILCGFLYCVIFMPLFNEVQVIIRNKRGRKKANKEKKKEKEEK